ncbi:penicillin-binding transpeptidase domain-containing protein [Clostridium oceanicum]|uniref:Penicillin-binding transpeptidase domain-containing protein n=1 Tax=Clostridium oceanicum TaxID=1543 RepID=A0ABP3UHQ4_9CLOT
MKRYLNKKRIYKVLIIFILIFSVLILRIYKFQYLDRDKFAVMADAQYAYKEPIWENKFKLLDTNGKDLLKYKDKYYAVIVPQSFEDNEKEEEKVLSILYTLKNYNKDYDLAESNVTKSGKLYYEIDKNTYEKLMKMKKLKGFYVYKTSVVDKDYNNRKEHWKLENMLLNPYKKDGKTFKNKDSLEYKIYDKTKDNDIDKIVYNKDLNGQIMSNEIEKASKSVNPKLTLDSNIQDKIRKVLENKKYKKYSQIGVALMESDTGKISGMAQKDETLPNVIIGASSKNGFPPGSIFKVIVEEAALENDVITEDDKFYCKGQFEKNHEGCHGNLNYKDAFTVSCNDIFSQIGRKVGFGNIDDIMKRQDLFGKVLNLNYEQKGSFQLSNNKKPSLEDGTLSLISFGQLMRMTPIEALSMVNVVVNNGVYTKPYLLESYVDNNNKTLQTEKTIKKKIIDKDNAINIKDQMIDVVKKGTGKLAYNKNILIGGKTGSTERTEKDGKGKIKSKSDGWFIGFFENNGKTYSMVVFVPNIDSEKESAGNTAVPIFYDIVKELNKGEILK